MKNFKEPARAGIASGIAVLAASAAFTPLAAYAQVKPTVTVVNSTSNPVNTRITNAVVPVEISNADPIPVAAQDVEGSRQIFAKTISVNLGGSNGTCNSSDVLAVPAGKRMVIEYVSALKILDAPLELVSVGLRIPNSQYFVIVPGKTVRGVGSASAFNFVAAGQYVHAFTDVSLWACADSNDQISDSFEVNITGYLVDKT
jgi:hypothetical protein